MSLFDKLTTEGLEKQEDRLGGYSVLPTDIYISKIKAAYVTTSSGGAMGINLILDINGQEYRETVYVTNKEGKNYFINNNKKKVPLPGFSIIDNICLITTGSPLAEQDTEDKVLQIYDYEQGKEVPQNVPVITELSGKEVAVAIVDEIENKREKKGNEYVPVAESREVNHITHVFHPEEKKTVVEALNDKEATFWDKWLEKNQGKKIDRRTIKDGNNTAAPSSGSDKPAQSPRKSLFGNK